MSQDWIRVAEPCLHGNERQYVLDCLDTTWISSRGKYIEQFEERMAEFCGVPFAIATNNGTTALHLALAALGIGPGDEVIVPTLTYIASVNAIRYCGATPVFVDAEFPYLGISPADVERKITSQTKAIITVPLYGHPVDFDAIDQIARQHGLAIVEDAAEALGASYKQRPMGSMGHCASFSFFGNKTITTGEGGMVVTNDAQLADRLRFLRGQAVSPTKNYWHTDVGYNYRMTNIAAALGCAQMEKIDDYLQRRQQVAHWYQEVLANHEDRLQLPVAASWANHSYWMYTVLLKDAVGLERDQVIADLHRRKIETRPVFYPVHHMPPYASDEAFPVSEKWSYRGISLPTHGNLTQSDVRVVCQHLIETLAMEEVAVETDRVRRAA